ncbi:uncharacterized protein STEHIDRAFT_164058 [Stereum hirsutum FP-91666 SS1]|uniref:Uncharacterized protein n=1 Tax=Stereum hirsutum (strain FP-91666) TaxID=721885 RepID=R7RXG4_STEHR|nr:uncharacterized protein STEHIDRAFT_164058 [Stereum hirsutum FP-91666 SS1]EIM79052.1 hypothetical protein STEHIDRAFT_164058 [Stereum hirsutum FP-91666 SS1]
MENDNLTLVAGSIDSHRRSHYDLVSNLMRNHPLAVENDDLKPGEYPPTKSTIPRSRSNDRAFSK